MTLNELLPVALNLNQVPVLIVGGGAVAARKATTFLGCGAQVSGIAPRFCENWPTDAPQMTRAFATGDCTGFGLVIAATDDRAVNRTVCQEADDLGIWYNDVSDPEGSMFLTSAVLRRGPISLGINTGGLSPVLAGHLRDAAAAAIGPEYERLIELVSDCAIELQHRGEFWRRLLASDVLENLRQGRESAALAILGTLTEEMQSTEP